MYQEKEKLSLIAALAIGLNAAVGAGVFSAPLALYATAGPAGIIAYILATLLILIIGQAFTLLIRRFQPRSFFFDIPAQWGGEIAGTTTLLLYSAGLIVALGLLGKIAGSLLAITTPIAQPILWGSILLALTALGSQLGTSWLAWGQYVLFGLTIAPMIIVMLFSFLFGNTQNMIPFMPHGGSSIFSALPIVVFGFFGFEAIPALISQIQNPEKNSARAILGTILITGLIYLLFVGSIFYILPPSAYTAASLGSALVYALPQYYWLISIINWAIIITIAGTLYAMFPAIINLIGQAQKKLSTKIITILVPASAIIIMLAAQNILILFNLTALGIAGAYGLTSWTLVQKRKNRKELLVGSMACIAALILCICALQGLW